MAKEFNYYGEKKTIKELRAKAFYHPLWRGGRNSTGLEQALENLVEDQFDNYENHNVYGDGDGGEGYLLDWIVLKDVLNAFKRLRGDHSRLKEENKELKKKMKRLEKKCTTLQRVFSTIIKLRTN